MYINIRLELICAILSLEAYSEVTDHGELGAHERLKSVYSGQMMRVSRPELASGALTPKAGTTKRRD